MLPGDNVLVRHMKQVCLFGEGVEGLRQSGKPSVVRIMPRGPKPAKRGRQPKLRDLIPCRIDVPNDQIGWRAAVKDRGVAGCEHASTHGHGSVPFDVADLPRNRRSLHLRIQRARRKCTACGAILVQTIPSVDEAHAITMRMRHDIFYTAIKHPFEQAAGMLGVDARKVEDVFSEHAAMLPPTVTKLPKVICIDETDLAGDFRFICYDPVGGTIVDILPDMTQATIEAFFRGITNRLEVETVVSDMRAEYLEMVTRFFTAALVIDRYHVVEPVNRAMAKARGRVVAAFKREKGKGSGEKGFKVRSVDHLLGRRWARLDKAQRAELARIWKLRFTGDLLEHGKPAPLEVADGRYLCRAYRLKEDLQEVYELKSADDARAALHGLIARGRADPLLRADFEDALNLIENHGELILNFYKDRRTNGFAEGMNRCLKQIEASQIGIGFDHLRAKSRLRYGTLIDREALKAY
ncbi:ISL3 family transposase [Methylobacterium sp. J-048]|uniref:ISL3 family transposase n=1 Tax=Methylobacterium sp. J-048 TaxID=2836635 RepID=UPI001FBBD4BE|nr:ISL3 family transposase [Methylobacterium sp. J-048]MCJ2059832.1 ISL3 family transposase [Methylobacterium sp. J-048]